jgi:hypothetical protein
MHFRRCFLHYGSEAVDRREGLAYNPLCGIRVRDGSG